MLPRALGPFGLVVVSIGLAAMASCSQSEFGGGTQKAGPAKAGADAADSGDDDDDNDADDDLGVDDDTNGTNGSANGDDDDDDDDDNGLGNPSSSDDTAGGPGKDDGTKINNDPSITTEDEISTLATTAAVGIAFDGKASICLDWKLGKLIVRNTGNGDERRFFRFVGKYTVKSKRGPEKVIDVNGEVPGLQLPGKWGAKVCGANPTTPRPQVPPDSDRENGPVITPRVSGHEACYDVDDALGERPGAVILHGVDFGLKKC